MIRLRVVEVQVVSRHTLLLTFSNSNRRLFDAAPYLWGKIFEPLKDPAYFRRVGVDEETGTIVWPNGADFCPDVLYEESQPISDDNCAAVCNTGSI